MYLAYQVLESFIFPGFMQFWFTMIRKADQGPTFSAICCKEGFLCPEEDSVVRVRKHRVLAGSS